MAAPAPTDIREAFPTLEDVATGAGKVLTRALEGDAAAGINGAVGFAFKDVNGNVVLPQLNNLGQLPVTLATSGQRSRAHGRVPGVALVAPGTGDYTGWQTVLSIPAVAASGYGDMAAKFSCRRDAIAELVYQDAGGSSIVLDATIVGPGQYTAPLALGPSEDTFVVPASATSPVFIIRAGQFPGTNVGALSDYHATLAVTAF